MNKGYPELLLDPRWQKKRLEILNRDEFECRLCMDGSKELHVHHHRYLRGHKPWEYENDDLVSLCKDCHQRIEALKMRLSKSLHTQSSVSVVEFLLDVLDGPDSILMVGIISSLRRRPDLLPHVSVLLTEIKSLDGDIAHRA